MSGSRLPPEAGSGKGSGPVGRAILLAGVVGAVGGSVCTVLLTFVYPEWGLSSTFVSAALLASLACWVVGVVVGIAWQGLSDRGAWLAVGLLSLPLAGFLEAIILGVTGMVALWLYVFG